MVKKILIIASLLIFLIGMISIYQQKNISPNLIEIINTTPGVHWKAGQNKYFEGRSIKQIMYLMGTLETPEQMKLQIKNIQPLKDLPTHFDSRDQWPKCQSIKQLRDQSTCGSCWAFGAVQAISDRICIASGQKLQIRISAQDLVSCCGINCGMGCGGGWPHAAWNHYKKQGLSTGWLWNTTNWCKPYSFPPCDHHTTGKYQPCGTQKPTPKCQKNCVSGYPKQYKNDLHHAKQVYALSKKVTQIQTQIMTNGPVQASFNVYEDFLTYKSGVYHYVSGKKLGGHSIKIIGWGNQNNVDYWLVANSWNQDWGDKGFFKIKRGNDQCGIENAIVAGIPLMI